MKMQVVGDGEKMMERRVRAREDEEEEKKINDVRNDLQREGKRAKGADREEEGKGKH